MIEIQNVSKTIKGTAVLEDINLSIQNGDFILLKGHNGCGKTMLIRLITRLIKPDKGSVIRQGKKTFGVLIETPNFFAGETAMYNLKYLAAINKRIGINEINGWLKRFNLYAARNEKVRTFSLGMRQRLALVQAMMEEPDILLLDEPFNGIDDENLAVAYSLINEYHQKGYTVIIASHGDCQRYCDFNKIVLMNAGRIQEIQQA